MRRALILVFLVAAACDPAGLPSVHPSRGGTPSASPVTVAVLRVVDGDTIVVAGGPKGTKVRLIGIDTPEREECFYRAATERMRALVGGRRVRLARDVSDTDRYGRLLRYVYVGEVFVNAVMVREGFAAAATYPPDVSHALEFVALARAARIARRGLWSDACPA